MDDKKLVYVAGALDADATTYIKNLHGMINWGNRVRMMGFSVFIPGLDFLCGIVFGNWEYKDYFENNQLILERCDAMFLVPGWEKSEGTAKEIEKAKKLKIPVFTSIVKLIEFKCKENNND